MSEIDRRTFLRGAAGSALALPALEAGLDVAETDGADEARAAGGPQKGPDEPLFYIVCFAGSASGSNGDLRNASVGYDMVPRGSDATGTDYPLEEPALQPLGREISVTGRDETVPVQEYVSLISGLSMPEATSPNDKPPGSRVAYDSNSTFHKYQIAPLMSGVSSEKGSRDRDIFTSGTSSDQVVADAWNQSRTFAGRAQARHYGSPNKVNWFSPLSTIDRGDGVEIIAPHIDPRGAFDDWIGTAPDQGGQSRRELLLGSSDQSVLDGVLESFNRLKTDANLPKSDRERLERHADKVRELEHDIDRLKDRMVCDGGFPKDIWGKRSGRKQAVGVDEKWMYEDLRAELMADLMVRSMACGRTNVGTLCYSLEASRLNIRHMGDQKDPGQIHGANHSSHWPIMSAQLVIKWHVAQWVKLLERLAEEPAPPPYDDESMLDRTAAVLLFESGAKKYAPNKVKTHTTDNMVALVGGKAGVDGKRLRGNVHVDAGNNAHPCSAQMSAMEAVGVQQNQFGELPWESHSELFEQV